MPVITITREMGARGKDVATGLGQALGLPVIYHEIADHLADRMRLRKSHVIRLLDGKAGLLERLTADKTSLFIHTADEIIAMAQQHGGAIIRGWGATHLLRDVPHIVGVRVCAPLEVRKRRMMARLNTEDADLVANEIRVNDEAHMAIMRRHFGIQWTDPELYDLVVNTQRVSVEECVDEVLNLVRSPEFAETGQSLQQLEDLALSARVRAALRRSPETRDTKVSVSSKSGRVTLGGPCSTEERIALDEVASGVSGVRHVGHRTSNTEGAAARVH